MQFINAVPDFFKEPKNNRNDLEKYFANHPAIFEMYFPMHCPKTEDRLNQALQKYPESVANIRLINDHFEHILRDIESRILEKYQVHFPNKIHLFVGTYGSNAFVTHEVIGDVYFATEKLSPIKEHLEIIVAHELGHVTHNLLSDQKQMIWSKVDWWHPFCWLYREGVATFMSQNIVETKLESSYYTYDDLGEEWLEFAKSNEALLKEAFLSAFDKGWTDADSKEWFKLRGGKQFGFKRLAY